jgi:hypothetical protein
MEIRGGAEKIVGQRKQKKIDTIVEDDADEMQQSADKRRKGRDLVAAT